MFKKADKLFDKLGFEKKEESKYIVEYVKYVEEFGYYHKISIIRKHVDTDHTYTLVQSYDPNLFDKNVIGNICIGMTKEEVKACLKKIKELKWN